MCDAQNKTNKHVETNWTKLVKISTEIVYWNSKCEIRHRIHEKSTWCIKKTSFQL